MAQKSLPGSISPIDLTVVPAERVYCGEYRHQRCPNLFLTERGVRVCICMCKSVCECVCVGHLDPVLMDPVGRGAYGMFQGTLTSPTPGWPGAGKKLG